jgi:hypothetical protein
MTNKLFFLKCEDEKSEKQKTITSFGSRCPFWENRGNFKMNNNAMPDDENMV